MQARRLVRSMGSTSRESRLQSKRLQELRQVLERVLEEEHGG